MHYQPKAPATPEHRRRIPVKNSPGMYKRGSRYQVMFRHRGKQKLKSFRTHEEAKRFQGSIHAGATLVSSRQPFRAYATDWIDKYHGGSAKGISEATRESYRDSLTRLAFPYFGPIRLDEIDAPFLRGYAEHLSKRGLAPDTVRRYVAPIKAMLSTAYNDGVLARNPAVGLRIVLPGDNEKRRTKRDGLTVQQTRDLLAEISADYSDLVYLLASTGVRVSEGLSVTWGDFQRDNEGRPVLQIRKSKSASGVRLLTVSPDTAHRLLKRREVANFSADSDPIFPNQYGKQIDAHNFRRRVFKPAAKRAGVPWATPHALRHGLATLMAEQGFSAAHIAAQLGHGDGGELALKRYIDVDRVESTAFADEAFSR